MTDINRTACTFSRPALNANTLKLIAVLAMVLDHAATVFLADTAPAALFFHAVGQIAAPIMCFFVAEGYAYTSNLKKYLLRLFIAAVISHVPYALCFKFTVWEFWYVTGVLWGLFLGLLAVTLWKRLRAPVWVRLLLLGLCCLLAYPANWNYIAVLWIDLKYEDGVQHVILNREDVSGLIRTPEVSMAASACASVPAVRKFLFSAQVDMAKKYNVIMDGRDIGTTILPNAQVKIFLTASPEVRAERRYKELKEKGVDVSYEETLADVIRRDKQDEKQSKAAEDSILLDNSELDFNGTVKRLLEIDLAVHGAVLKERIVCAAADKRAVV